MPSKRRVLLIIGFILAALTIVIASSHTSGSAEALRKYKTELVSRGEKLTYAELTNSRSGAPNTSMAVLGRAMAKLDGSLSAADLDIRRFVGPAQALAVWQDDNAWTRRNPQATWTDYAQTVKDAAPAIAQMRDALAEPALYSGGPGRTLFGPPTAELVTMRTAAQSLAGVTLCEVRLGNLEEATLDLRAMAGLALMYREELGLVSQMVRVGIVGLGVATSWEALQATNWTEPELEQLQRAWEAVDLVHGLETALVGERAWCGELRNLVRQSTASDPSRIAGQSALGTAAALANIVQHQVLMPAYFMTCMNEDELFFMQTLQAGILAMRGVAANGAWPKLRQELDTRMASAIPQFGTRLGRFRYWFSRIALPNCSRALATGMRIETERRLLVVAIALKRYERQQAAAPANLEALVPRFLAAVPSDPMSGKPVRYQHRPDGTYCLYSVGEDGQDHGGDARPNSARNYGLWEGRDAVWPYLAK